ncbi:MAG TPA: TIGR01440 family protein, partial [Lachnospiraceae bacterium]|nr:TIGR01440 family protein [Lachnospiraceae bacterium]
MDYSKITNDAKQAVQEIIKGSYIKKGGIFVIGC